MRLTRRAVRDYNFRGTGVGETMDMWANVRRGEKLYISPFKHRANYIFDSSLPYEVSVMKHYAMPLLEAVPQENVRRRELLDLIHGFEHFLPIDPALVPPGFFTPGVHRRRHLRLYLSAPRAADARLYQHPKERKSFYHV